MTKPQFTLRTMRAGFCAAGICGAAVSATPVPAQPPPAAPQGQPAMQQLYVGRDPTTFKDGRLYSIWPSQVDPELKRFDKPNLVLTKNGLARTADLLVFFRGTTADPNSAWPYLETGANARYRVIGV